MHLQVKAKTSKSGSSGMSIDGDGGDDIAISATYRAGALSEMLTILRDAGFNLRAAGGSQVELGGDFWFWVDERPSDADHEVAAIAARDLLRGHEYEADTFEVHARHLSDTQGTLLDFVNEVTQGKLLVENISVGTPDDEGIPVQIFTAQVRRRSSNS